MKNLIHFVVVNTNKIHSQSIIDLDECMENNVVICKSVSYILEYVLKNIGVDISTEVDQNDMRKCPHRYNIQTHSFTRYFGIDSIYNMDYVISRFEQEKMDKKNGYISEENYYSDDYLYLLYSVADLIENFDEKTKFLLENIDICECSNIGYTDRQWHHKRILEEFFDKKEFNYNEGNGKIRIVDCYKDGTFCTGYILSFFSWDILYPVHFCPFLPNIIMNKEKISQNR